MTRCKLMYSNKIYSISNQQQNMNQTVQLKANEISRLYNNFFFLI